MDNWSKLFTLLAEEAALWRDAKRETEKQLKVWKTDKITEEEAERYLKEQERLQTLLMQKQTEIAQLQTAIEAEKQTLLPEQRAELEKAIQVRTELQKLQTELTVQSRELETKLHRFGEKQRHVIRDSRSRQAAQQTYQAPPLSAESALLDQKK